MPQDTPASRRHVDELIQAAVKADSAGSRDEARGLVEQALRIAREAGDTLAEAAALNELGVQLRYDLDYKRSEELLREAARAAAACGDKPAMAAARANLASTLRRAGKPEQSHDECEAASRLYRELGNLVGVNRMLHLKANLFEMQGMLEEAKAILDEVVELDEITGDQNGRARSLGTLALMLRRMGRRTEAEVKMRLALDLFRKLNSPADVCQALTNLAGWALDEGEPERAVPLLDEVLEITDRHQLAARRARGLSAYTLAHYQMGRLDDALDVALQTEQLPGSSRDPVIQTTLQKVRAFISLQRHNPRLALQYAEQLEALLLETGSGPDLLAVPRRVRAAALLVLGEPAAAREAIMAAMEALDEAALRETHAYLKCTALLARIEQQNGRPDDARFLAEEAEVLRARLNVTESTRDPELKELIPHLREMVSG
ncbi:MAG: tetratricopeptide repeat protein [Planctomycetes bacterium]|nr:tetratricopeptide repeat protein [Planctomycetota bacterium]